jgi:hypothetical protein
MFGNEICCIYYLFYFIILDFLVCKTEAKSPEEVKALFAKEFNEVWAVFLDTFQFYEQKEKREAKDVKHVNQLLWIFKRIFMYLPDKVKEKWQIRSIGKMLIHVRSGFLYFFLNMF